MRPKLYTFAIRIPAEVSDTIPRHCTSGNFPLLFNTKTNRGHILCHSCVLTTQNLGLFENWSSFHCGVQVLYHRRGACHVSTRCPSRPCDTPYYVQFHFAMYFRDNIFLNCRGHQGHVNEREKLVRKYPKYAVPPSTISIKMSNVLSTVQYILMGMLV